MALTIMTGKWYGTGNLHLPWKSFVGSHEIPSLAPNCNEKCPDGTYEVTKYGSGMDGHCDKGCKVYCCNKHDKYDDKKQYNKRDYNNMKHHDDKKHYDDKHHNDKKHHDDKKHHYDDKHHDDNKYHYNDKNHNKNHYDDKEHDKR